MSNSFCFDHFPQDYHVIFVYHEGLKSLVFDLDTELSFPCTLKEYATACIGDERTLKEEFRRFVEYSLWLKEWLLSDNAFYLGYNS